MLSMIISVYRQKNQHPNKNSLCQYIIVSIFWKLFIFDIRMKIISRFSITSTVTFLLIFITVVHESQGERNLTDDTTIKCMVQYILLKVI